MKIQHALRAFTQKDHESLRRVVKNFPRTSDYPIQEEILALGTGEALVSVLDEKGRPASLVRVQIAPPRSRMDVLQESEIDALLAVSSLYQKYHTTLDRESAHEILSQKLQVFHTKRLE